MKRWLKGKTDEYIEEKRGKESEKSRKDTGGYRKSKKNWMKKWNNPGDIAVYIGSIREVKYKEPSNLMIMSLGLL